jgi:hypothetical protein
VARFIHLDEAFDQPSDAAQHCDLEPIILRREQFWEENNYQGIMWVLNHR